MQAKTSKRIIAFLIDITIILFTIGVVVNVKEKDKTVKQLRSDFNVINELYASGELEFPEYFERYAVINQQIEQECVIYIVFNLLLILIYFVLLPYVWEGRTFGKKIMKIRIISHDGTKVSVVSYIIRNIILTGLAQMILMLLFLYLLPSQMYLIFSSILTFLQLILVITSLSMILYRKDKRGLHDILSGTKVVLDSKI